MPRVSVIIPLFNSARTVERAIDSVLAQSFTDFEIVAADDGSRDRTCEIVRRYGGQVRLVEQQNRGPSAARNLAIANSSASELLAFLDGDDWWEPAMLSAMVEAMDAHAECVLAYCDLRLVDSMGSPFHAALERSASKEPPTLADMLQELWPILPSAVVIRRSALTAADGWPERLRAFEDVYLWMLLREQGAFVHVPQMLACWRFALFPDPLKRARGQDEAGRIFRAMVRERYGVDPIQHVRARWRAPRSILGYIGLEAMERGDRATARRALARAIQLDPWRIRNYLRLARTIASPARIARALGGKSRNARA